MQKSQAISTLYNNLRCYNTQRGERGLLFCVFLVFKFFLFSFLLHFTKYSYEIGIWKKKFFFQLIDSEAALLENSLLP